MFLIPKERVLVWFDTLLCGRLLRRGSKLRWGSAASLSLGVRMV